MLHHPTIRALRACVLSSFLALSCALGGCQALESLDRQTNDVLDDINDPGHPSSRPTHEKSPTWKRGDLPHKRPAQGREKDTVECWDSFPTAKKSMLARYGMTSQTDHEWHHVVGQMNWRRGKMTEHDLHCTDNLIYLHESAHKPITRHYANAPDPPRPGFSHVYEWQLTLSFEEQWNYGIEVLKQHDVTIPERMQP